MKPAVSKTKATDPGTNVVPPFPTLWEAPSSDFIRPDHIVRIVFWPHRSQWSIPSNAILMHDLESHVHHFGSFYILSLETSLFMTIRYPLVVPLPQIRPGRYANDPTIWGSPQHKISIKTGNKRHALIYILFSGVLSDHIREVFVVVLSSFGLLS